MVDVRALVVAAGRGTRASLPYPKTLYPIQGKPILVRILELLLPFDNQPTIIVSPEGERPIIQSILQNSMRAYLVIQPEPIGMGDAVLRFAHSPAFADAEHVLLIWGDIPFIHPETISGMVDSHIQNKNDFTFVTRKVDSAYTLVSRDAAGYVTGVVETRECGSVKPQAGERDIGLFIFRKAAVFKILSEELPGKWGKSTGEHGFLYIISHLAMRGLNVSGLPLAKEKDLISLNSLKDVAAYL